MRLGFLLAILAASHSFQATVVNADDPKSIIINKAAEELVATPIQELWKDIYEALVRKRGAHMMRRLVYAVTRLVGDDEALSLTNFIVNKLKKEVFDGRVNTKMWKYISMELYYALSDWWSKTPENPLDSAEIGVWLSLINVHKNVLVPALRGSKRAEVLSDLLTDEDLTLVRQWVAEWKVQSKVSRGNLQQPAVVMKASVTPLTMPSKSSTTTTTSSVIP